MRLLKVLYKLEMVEERISEFYWALHKKFENDRKASQLFYKLYIEERNHLALVLYEKRVVWQNQGSFDDVEFDLDGIDKFLREMEKTFQGIKTITLREAVEVALEFESGAAEKHLKKGTLLSNVRFSLFLESLGRSDEEHVGKLQKFLTALQEEESQETSNTSGVWAVLN